MVLELELINLLLCGAGLVKLISVNFVLSVNCNLSEEGEERGEEANSDEDSMLNESDVPHTSEESSSDDATCDHLVKHHRSVAGMTSEDVHEEGVREIGCCAISSVRSVDFLQILQGLETIPSSID
jgi:hypothetical protein